MNTDKMRRQLARTVKAGDDRAVTAWLQAVADNNPGVFEPRTAAMQRIADSVAQWSLVMQERMTKFAEAVGRSAR